MKKPVYALYNEELGYIADCPAFFDKREAELEAGSKCRRHRAVELRPEDIRPCHPMLKYRTSETMRKRCEKCPRFAGWNTKDN